MAAEALKKISEQDVNGILSKAGYTLEQKDNAIPDKKDETSDSSLKQECGCKEQQKMSASTQENNNNSKKEEIKEAVATAPAPVAAPVEQHQAAPAKEVVAAPAPAVNIDMAPVASAITEGFKNTQQLLLEQLTKELGVQKKQQESVKEEAVVKPSSRVDDSAAKAKNESFSKMKEWFIGAAKRQNVGPMHEWTVSKDEILRKYTGVGYDGIYPSTFEPTMRKVEGVTVSSGDMPQSFSSNIQRIPGGRLPLNIRPYTNYVSLANEDRANWYKIDGMDAGTITEGSEPSAASQTVTKVTATPAIRGVYQKIGYSQVENAPFDLVQAVQDQMALSLIDDEATDLLTTVYDAVSATNWVNGNSGAAISSDDVSSMTFKREGLLGAKRLIQQQGFDVRPGNLVLFLHPKAYQELLLDTNISNYYQYASPDITARGVLEMLYGVDIVVTDHVKAKDNATNDTYRNVMAIKSIAFGLASARDVTFEAQKRNELQQILLTATQRVKSAVIDETGTARISTAQ